MNLRKWKRMLIVALAVVVLLTGLMPVWAAETETPHPSPTATPVSAFTSVSDETIATGNHRPQGEGLQEGFVLAFLDGEKRITPDHSRVEIKAALVRIAEESVGTAQWYIDGIAREDYSSDSFTVYNGKMTALELEIPFTPETENASVEVALEVTVKGETRRIAKTLTIENYDENWYREREIARMYEMIQPVDIEATVRYWTETYADKSLSRSNGSLPKGAQVVYTDHSGTYAASIWIPEEQRLCWVPYSSITVSDKNYTIYEDFSDTDKELFVNAKGYESQTDYLVWVNLERQRVNVFTGSKGNWDLVRVSTCASGANITPTPAGEYTYCALGNGWYHATYYVKPVLYINLSRGIALHSILFNPNGTVQDGTQGTPASHGCVRMPLEEVQWLADYLPINTKVVVF